LPASLDEEIRLLRTSFWSARDPNGRAFAPLAEAFRRQGNLDEAESLLAEGLARHPTFTTALFIASRVARDRGDLALAREHLDRLLHLDGGNVLALRDRAEARLIEGDRDGALRDLREASRLEPGNEEIRVRLEAAETARTPLPPPVEPPVEEPEPDRDIVDRPILTRTMGDIYARQGFLDRAVEVYEHLQAENPDDEGLRARLNELRGGGATEREVDQAPSLAADAASEREVAPEASRPRATDPGSRTIAAYFGDLLAWVPGAVPIASLAPGAPVAGSPSGRRSASDSTDDGLGSPRAQSPGIEGGSDKPKDEVDDFHRWLEGLGT
jgi:tetratricopeptide (TPR) repeat protein